MQDIHISEVRSFNRFYTAFIGVLNKKFLNDKYSLPELRVLQAIHLQPGITAREIIMLLNIDKSYLSRILLQFEKKKLVTKKATVADGRAFHLFLTAFGKKEFGAQDKATYRQIQQLLINLPDKDCVDLVACMTRIKAILSKPTMQAK